MNRVIGFIPARGGSKGVKRKNVRLLNGKPLIAYTIECAQRSKFITDLYVTTDDSEVIKIAKQYGVKTIYRPDNLSDDVATMDDVIEHSLKYLNINYSDKDIFTLLQPTCPFRSTHDVDQSILTLRNSAVSAVVGVNEALHTHPERFYREENGCLKKLMPEFSGLNRQQLPTFYIRNGVVYTLKVLKFMENKVFSPEDSSPLVIPLERCVNIDEEEDFLYAEFKMKRSAL